MKYIRTKEDVYDLDKYLIENATKKCFRGVITGVDSKEDIEIIKQADTIEELCDEYVIMVENEHYLDTARYGLNMIKTRLPKEQNYTLYAAIWTDKGLIYVAKMKGILSNGEIDWELL